jgi:ferredoxin
LSPPLSLPEIEAAIRATGLTPRGAFHPDPADAVPPLADGRTCRTLVLLGNIGGSLWDSYRLAPEAQDGRPDPMNRWCARVVSALARDFGGRALFPFGEPPYLPFLRWAQKAETLFSSPLGIMIHPDHGLWHAYRGAIALPEVLDLPPRAPAANPCDSCADKPCLTTCPVGAFTTAGYDVAACAAHVAAAAGADCLDLGCRARRACPVAPSGHYRPEQARFHMEAFLAARDG